MVLHVSSNQYLFIAVFLILILAFHLENVTATSISTSHTSPTALKASSDENPRSFWPQFISMTASFTAGLSSILASQLSKRFPLSFHASSPFWFLPLIAVPGYLLIYFGLLLYGLFPDTTVLSTTLALQVRQQSDPLQRTGT